MLLYTIVADYEGGTYVAQVVSFALDNPNVTSDEGGTYVAQVNADDIHQAVSIWAANFDTETGLQVSDELQHEQEDDCEPVLLNGLSNVWCTSYLISDKLMLINIVQTVAA